MADGAWTVEAAAFEPADGPAPAARTFTVGTVVVTATLLARNNGDRLTRNNGDRLARN